MRKKNHIIQIKRKTLIYVAAILITLASVTPVLADYLGPNRTVTETGTVCKVVLYSCQYVASKDIWKYKTTNSWSCSNESQPWEAYSDKPSPLGCYSGTRGDKYWGKTQSTKSITITYDPAIIDGSLQNCTLNNGWCTTPPQLSLIAEEPITGYNIVAIEGTLNGQNFACVNASCSVPLPEGENTLNYWALSSWGDSSEMETTSAKVDSQPPVLAGTFTGSSGSNSWYVSPVQFDGSASDATSGLASFTCSLDGTALGSCTSISMNNDGVHKLVLTALDNAGNIYTLEKDISIDTKSPTLSAALDGLLGSNDWYNNVLLHASATDPIPASGLSSFEYNIDNTIWQNFPGSGVLDLPEGKHSVEVRALDTAGHSVSSTKSFALDSVVPNILLDPIGTLGANNWYVTSLDLSASASDATSGMDIFEYSVDNLPWITYTTPLKLTDGSHNISFWAQDKAGLVAQVDRIYQVDTRSPQIAGSLSGTPGTNGWYISSVTLSASSSDPLPGSGLEAFTYILDGAVEIPYTTGITIPDGIHKIQLNVKDKAGLTYSMQQSINVDTIRPSLLVNTSLSNWIKGNVSLSGVASDGGSGISKVEISLNGGQSWQSVMGTTSWNYEWDTRGSSNGPHNVIVRVVDQAGLTTEQMINVSVDNNAPSVSMPSSWFQWETITLDAWDDGSGLSEAKIEISDPDGRWPKRAIDLDPNQFPLSFKWDRRFGDNTVAPNGTYEVEVIALDKLGNTTHQKASVKILIDILPPGPTATAQPYSRVTSTPIPTYTSTPTSLPTATPTAVVSVFGNIDPTIEATPTPSVSLAPRETPTQVSALDWLEAIFSFNEGSTDQVTELDSSSQSTDSRIPDLESGVLWGTTAAAVAGAVTGYVLEEKRKREEEEARKRAEKAALKAEKAKNKAKLHAQKMEKLEAKWAQEAAWEQARLEQSQKDFATRGQSAKIEREEQKEEVAWTALITASQKKADEKKRAEELKEAMEAYYSARKQGEALAASTAHAEEKSWWQKGIDWIDDHQTEIALGIGVAVGVGAIILSGGVATPLVAAGWIAGAAAVAGVTVAGGTIALNNYYDRDWDENLLSNVLAAGVAAAAVTGAGFLFQAVAGGAGTYCTANPNICGHIEPIFNALDTAEEASLAAKLAYQTWMNDPAAADTALELQMEHMDGGMPGNSVSNELPGEALEALAKYGDDALDLIELYGDDAIQIILAHGDEGIALLQKYGDNAVSVLNAVDLKAAKTLLETLDEDVLEYAVEQGPDALAALSHWSVKDLQENGLELALRAEKDAKALASMKKLISLRPIDPKNLTQEQQELIKEIAANSTQYADEGQVVLGAWIDMNSGFIESAKDTGSGYYSPHPDIWNSLGQLGEENQSDVAWLINQQVIQSGIDKGLPFEYTLNGIEPNNVKNEIAAVQALFSGQTDTDIMKLLKKDYMPARMKELQELKNAGYELTFDSINNSYILIKP